MDKFGSKAQKGKVRLSLSNPYASRVIDLDEVSFDCIFLFIATALQVEEPGKENNITRKSHLAPFPESIGRKLNRKIFETLSKANIDSQFVRIAPGVFEMGSPKDEIGRDKDEYRHKVEITEPYFMAKFETTIEEWNSVNNVIKRWGKLNIPINIRTIISVIIEHGQKSFLKKLPKFLNQRLRSMAANKDIDCLADFGASHPFSNHGRRLR